MSYGIGKCKFPCRMQIKQGWWSRLKFNGSGSCSKARFLKLLSSDSGAGHFPFMTPTPAPFDLNFADSGSAPI